MKSILILLLGYSLFNFIDATFLLLLSDALIGQVITGIVTLGVAYMTYRTGIRVNKVSSHVHELAIKVDGRLSELLEVSKSNSEQKGNREGRNELAKEGLGQKEQIDRNTQAIIDAVNKSKDVPAIKVVIEENKDKDVIIKKNLDK